MIRPRARSYSVNLSDQVVRTIPDRFLSFTIDTSVVIGGRWWGDSKGLTEGLSKDRVRPLDLKSPVLASRAGFLAPALLRVGGTEADRLHYGFDRGVPSPSGPRPYVLRKSLWKDLCTFAGDQGFGLLFTVAAGPEARNAWGDWDPRDAVRLLEYTARKNLPVAAWELGNEVNAYPFVYGWSHRVSGDRYAREFAQFAALVRELHPGALAVGPSSAFWPLVGEPNPLLPALCRSSAAADLGALSFHYYPQQSRRGRVAVRRAREGTLFNARTLDGAGRWIRGIQRVRDRGPGRGTPIWVTETGHALYGGQPGLSNTWVSTPWWVDQLAAMAHEGVDTVFRQSLVGSDYGLLEEGTFSPRPDYHVSFLWKKLIGTNVYARPKVKGPDRKLRVWRMGGRDGIPWVILVNLDQNRAAAVNWGRPAGRRFVLGPETGPRSFRLTLNGVTVDDRLEELWGTDYLVKRHFLSSPPAGAGPENLVLPPLGCAFVEVP